MKRHLVRFSWVALVATLSVQYIKASESAENGLLSLPSLPKAVTSFGAEVLDGWVYVYGGHTGKAHSYSVETTLGDFVRLKLDGGSEWKTLPGATRAQGTRLFAYENAIYRVGGLQPRDEAGSEVGLYSLTEFARYDLEQRKWENLPPMPDARSSHEAVIVESKVLVGGGWKMEGEAGGKFWYDTMFIIDLAKPELKWEVVPQTFQRRALSAESVGSKVYFIGGMDTENDPSRKVNVYDVATGEWSEGPMIPSGPMQGFGSAACRVDGRLIVSPYSAKVLALNAAGDGWEFWGELRQRRFFHRIVPTSNGGLLAIAGASRRHGHLATLEMAVIKRR
ncbi:MAG: N-acetylneuraminate epimerase [Verrucomicrobia subdivision 3 bacterium]|nr:N-acetylneuraminate epimerase [Limisphaerales bacterium]MCS1413326.1 N-acetylneuraminate epimerase [Limisphaerales bacterium]